MDLKYWKKFENSGRIEDYLSFLSCERQERTAGTGRLEEDSDAGIYMCDRNHIEADSRGRIR